MLTQLLPKKSSFCGRTHHGDKHTCVLAYSSPLIHTVLGVQLGSICKNLLTTKIVPDIVYIHMHPCFQALELEISSDRQAWYQRESRSTRVADQSDCTE